jgi:hypothetical protein
VLNISEKDPRIRRWLAEARRNETLSDRLLIIPEGHQNYFGFLNKSSGNHAIASALLEN